MIEHCSILGGEFYFCISLSSSIQTKQDLRKSPVQSKKRGKVLFAYFLTLQQHGCSSNGQTLLISSELGQAGATSRRSFVSGRYRFSNYESTSSFLLQSLFLQLDERCQPTIDREPLENSSLSSSTFHYSLLPGGQSMDSRILLPFKVSKRLLFCLILSLMCSPHVYI